MSKPETAAGHGMLEELDKRRKGYAAGERLCVFGGYAGHVEAILSIVRSKASFLTPRIMTDDAGFP